MATVNISPKAQALATESGLFISRDTHGNEETGEVYPSIVVGEDVSDFYVEYLVGDNGALTLCVAPDYVSGLPDVITSTREFTAVVALLAETNEQLNSVDLDCPTGDTEANVTPSTENAPVILSYGGGKDSTALIAIDLDRDASAQYLGIDRATLDAAFPAFDTAVFANTGAEFASTYQLIERVGELLGDRLIVVQREGENIEEWCDRLGIIPVMPGAAHVCSRKYKGEVLADWSAKQGYQSPTWLIGIEANEGRRAGRFTPPKGDTATYRYPLMELGLDRSKLDGLLAHLGWPPVHKSSCVFCPFMSEAELLDMYRNHPEEWARAERIEARFQRTSAVKHQAWIDAGRPLNARRHAPRGMWRLDSWAEGARLFARTSNKLRLSVPEWAHHFDSIITVQ